jgi:hypothetical protein
MANLLRRGNPASAGLSRLNDPFEMMRDLIRWDPFAELGAMGILTIKSGRHYYNPTPML